MNDITILDRSIFTVNPYCNINVKEIADTKVIVVDNFYEYPDKVRDLAMWTPAVPNVTNASPGLRGKIRTYDEGKAIYNFQDKLLKKYYTNKDTLSDFDIEYTTFNYTMLNDFKNASTTEEVHQRSRCQPHIDFQHKSDTPITYAGLVYLNTPEECNGGTAFYKHKKTGIINYTKKVFKSLPSIDGKSNLNAISYLHEEGDITECNNNDIWINDGNSTWELVDKIDMKYNRFMFYPSTLFHAPYIKNNTFEDFYRILQLFFMRTL